MTTYGIGRVAAVPWMFNMLSLFYLEEEEVEAQNVRTKIGSQ